MLRSYERHVAVFILSILSVLGFLSYSQKSLSTYAPGEILVHVVGAVQETHVRIFSGCTVDDVLSHVSFLETASLIDVFGSKKIYADTILVIPYEQGTTVYITGSVKESKILILPANANALYILDHVDLKEQADIARFKRKRVFKNGSIIVIPEKKKK